MANLPQIQHFRALQQAQYLAYELDNLSSTYNLIQSSESSIYEQTNNIKDIQQLKFYLIDNHQKLVMSKSLAKIILQISPTFKQLFQRYRQLHQLNQQCLAKIHELQTSEYNLIQQEEQLRHYYERSFKNMEKQLGFVQEQKQKLRSQLETIHQDYMVYIGRLIQKQQYLQEHNEADKKEYEFQINKLKQHIKELNDEINQYHLQRQKYAKITQSHIYQQLHQNYEIEQPQYSDHVDFYDCQEEQEHQLKKNQSKKSLAQDINGYDSQSQSQIQICTPFKPKIDRISTKQSLQTEYHTIWKHSKNPQKKYFIRPKINKSQITIKKKLRHSLFLKNNHSNIYGTTLKSSSFLQRSMLAIIQEKSSAFGKIHNFLHQNIVEKKLKKFKK